MCEDDKKNTREIGNQEVGYGCCPFFSLSCKIIHSMLSQIIVCLDLHHRNTKVAHKWHEMRTDLEQNLLNLTGGDTKIVDGQAGSYKKDVFMGHCSKDGQDGYLPIGALEEVIKIVAPKLWN